MTGWSIHRRIAAAAVTAALMAGCSSAGDGGPGDSTSVAPGGESILDWVRCGSIRCAELDVHAAPGDATSPVVRLKVYGRESSAGDDARTLVLLGDRSYGYDARQLASLAPVVLGAGTNRFDVVSVDMRGSGTVVMPAGFEHHVASLDSVDDLETLRDALGGERVSVMGWGTGATVGAAWMMSHPESIEAMVLDTPADPSASTRKQGIRQIEWSIGMERAAVKWCASHLSCPLNANTTADLRKILKHLRDGRMDPRITRELLARAATRALAEGDPRTLFVGISDADDGDPGTIIDLAGDPPSVDEARAACADVSQGSAAAIVRAFAKMTTSKRLLFHIGVEGPLYSQCADLPAAGRPLGTVRAVAGAIEAKVLTVVADADPTCPFDVVQRMSRRMKWSHKTVASSRHLVVGFDRGTTAAAVDFLSS